MKITKSELKEMIKEEAERYMKLKTLNSKKENIEKQLNEMYDMEEGAFGKVAVASTEEEDEEIEEGLGSFASKLAGKVQKAGAGALVSDEQKAAGKQAFDTKMSKLQSELQSKNYADDKIITVDTNGKQIPGLNVEALIQAAEQYAYQGKLNYGVSRAGKVVVSFAAGSLTGATTGGHNVFEENNLSESEIRNIFKEESKKAEEAKTLKERAEKIMDELKNL